MRIDVHLTDDETRKLLGLVLQEFRGLRVDLIAGLARIEHKENHLMSQITQLRDQEKADFTAIGVKLDDIKTGIAALDQKIIDLQNSPGTLNPEDTAALQEIKDLSSALKTKVEGISTAMPGSGSGGGTTTAPVLSTMLPTAIPAGTAASVTVTGTGLTGVTSLVVNAALGVTDLSVPSDTQLTATITVPDGFAPSTQSLSVNGANGASNSLSFTTE